MSISEKEKYQIMWNQSGYREHSPGVRSLDTFISRCNPPVGAKIVDYGCGTGRMLHALQQMGYDVEGIDIADNALDNNLRGLFPFHAMDFTQNGMGVYADYATSIDVFEHFPDETAVINAIRNMCAHTRHLCFFRIYLAPDRWGEPFGLTLHTMLRSPEWWTETLDVFLTSTFIELEHPALVYVGRPKPID